MKRETVKRLQRELSWANAMRTICERTAESYVRKLNMEGLEKAVDAVNAWGEEVMRIEEELEDIDHQLKREGV